MAGLQKGCGGSGIEARALSIGQGHGVCGADDGIQSVIANVWKILKERAGNHAQRWAVRERLMEMQVWKARGLTEDILHMLNGD